MNSITSSERETSSRLLERAREIVPLIKAEASRSEELRTLSPASIEALRQTGLFWIVIPREIGGEGASLSTALRVWEEISYADASCGWSLMANSAASALAAALLKQSAVDAMFEGKRPVMGGMLAPGGTAIYKDGKYKVAGKFKFGSGTLHADWVTGGFLVSKDGVQQRYENGEPVVRVAYVQASQVVFDDNWDVLGLRGTGSVDYAIPEAEVDEDFTFDRANPVRLRGQAFFDLGFTGIGGAGHAAVALGVMRRSLEEIARIATVRKRPAYSTVLADSPLFQHEFGLQEAKFRAARALNYEVYDEIEAALAAGVQVTQYHRDRIRQSMIHAHRIAAEVVQFCHVAGASDSLKAGSDLGRCLRDIHSATQHIYVDPINLVDAAKSIMRAYSS